MQDSPFRKVTDAAVPLMATILTEEGVRHKKHGTSFSLTSNWTAGFICPKNCGDTSGSASFTTEGFLKCHQCQAKADLFTWIAEVEGSDPWTVCKRLADRLGVSLTVRKIPGGRSMPKAMTRAILQSAIHELLDSDAAKDARAFLGKRHLLNRPALAELGVGFIRGYIVFAQFDTNGELSPRYRGYAPGGQGAPWLWFGTGNAAPGLWPAQRAPADGDKVLLLEGEWDVMTALFRLRLHKQGWTPCTFGGAGQCPAAHTMPKWLHHREVHIAYDNDTFQGIDFNDYTVVTKPGKNKRNAELGMKARRSNLLEKVRPEIESLGCDVVIRKCPIDPAKVWGGDLRDWVDAGGRDLNDWKEFPSKLIPELSPTFEVVPFDEVFTKVGCRVRTVVQVDSLSSDIIIPDHYKLECPMGTDRACATCPAVRNFPDRIIMTAPYARESAMSLRRDTGDAYFIKHVIQPPRGCPRHDIVPMGTVAGSRWNATTPVSNLEEETTRTIEVISDAPPSLTGDVEVTGTVYGTDEHTILLRADKIVSLDNEEVDLRPHANDLRLQCPWNASSVKEIDDFLTKRWQDLSFNVTKVHGRRELVITHDLLAHSVLAFNLRRKKAQRGWIDVCVFGDTRTGKTVTFEALFDFHQLGVLHTAISNASRAGVVMGTDQKGLLRPGMFPRCHRKMLALDEWHHLVQNNHREHPATWIQSARDAGHVSSAKISGLRKMPARVRFLSIANWSDNSKDSFEFYCQHLGALYGSPEAVARLDFAVVTAGRPSQNHVDKTEQFWTAERTRALILRAWSQTADMVHIDSDAIELAQCTTEDWDGEYETKTIPLYTMEEKLASLLRIAISVANICFSHPEGDINAVRVSKVHVEWAREWLMQTWTANGYADFSYKERRRNEVAHQFEAEQLLTCKLGLEDFVAGESALSMLLQPFTLHDFCAISGKEAHDALKWIARAQGLRIFRKGRFGHYVQFTTTEGGRTLILALVHLAAEEPEEYVSRYRALNSWFGKTTGNPELEELAPRRASSGFDSEEVPF